MVDQPPGNANEKGRPGLSRREFLGAVGAAAAAGGALLQSGSHANAQSQQYYYQDSFGNVVPAGTTAIEMGIYPPPVVNQPENNPPNTDFLAPDDAPPAGCSPGPGNTTFYSCGSPQYNVLLIMVDQMRDPSFWVPANQGSTSGQNLVNASIPNISGLAAKSFSFPNFRVNATVCGPSRACFLTGLYAQQHGIFSATASGAAFNSNNQAPPLLPFNNSASWAPGDAAGFPTIANVLSQAINVGSDSGNQIQFDCTWIGKWHLSCMSGVVDGNPGENGPSDYGFNSAYSIPNTPKIAGGKYPSSAQGYPSPNGLYNDGAGGDFLDATQAVRNVVAYTPTLIGNNTVNNNYQVPVVVQLNDAAITRAFTQFWLPNANTNFVNVGTGGQLLQPWFCAVSFVNPHDISEFPFAYNLNATDGANFGGAANNSAQGFQPPPAGMGTLVGGNNCPGTSCLVDQDIMTVANYNLLPYSGLPPGGGNNLPWNWEDLSNLDYFANNGKPGLQYVFQQAKDTEYGTIHVPGAYNNGNGVWSTPSAWTKFLNYYLWMQGCVDFQVGQVLGTGTGASNGLAQSRFSGNTVVIFTSDHGEYGGSHGMHTKGGGLYEESLRVPLYISYPTQRSNSGLNGPVRIPYVCSSVDLLPYLYTLALGNHQWRNNNSDMIYHLAERESLADAIFYFSNNFHQIIQQRRISSIPLHAVVGDGTVSWQNSQPFVLHTADDYTYAKNAAGTQQPSHAIAFVTTDISDQNNNSAPFYGQNVCGGGKLGVYDFWATCNQSSAPIYPANNSNNSQYEFYNYSTHPSPAGLTPNQQELGNQYFNNTTGAVTPQANNYLAAFNNNTPPVGISVPTELYGLYGMSGGGLANQQVQAAIQIAFQNYMTFLNNQHLQTNNNGNLILGCMNPIGGSSGPYSF